MTRHPNKDFQTFFQDPIFQAQFIRTIGHATSKGAEIGECLQVGSLIADGDRESWYEERTNQALTVLKQGDSSATNKHHVSARCAFLRASNYFRSASIMLEDTPQDPRVNESWFMQAEAFKKALNHFHYKVERIEIPFEEITLPGYFYFADDTEQPRKTLIITGGSDGTLEEMYFIASDALKRGYNCLTFDGPGQGGVLRTLKLPFRPDWEHVMRAVVDFACNHSAVDTNKIALLGISLGGYLSARAVTEETRIAACIVDPGIYDSYETAMSGLPPPVIKMFEENRVDEIDRFFEESFEKNEKMRFKFHLRMWRYCVNSPRELILGTKPYTLKGRVQNIKCPMLVCDNELEYISFGQAKRLYDELPGAKDYLLFKVTEGAGGHCEPISPQLFAEKVYNWLDKTLEAISPSDNKK